MEKVILEISVDRNNDKGVYIAEQVLNIFHNTLETNKYLFGYKRYRSPEFTFEIANVKGAIHFFFIINREYKDLLENQLYAHYPNVEIKEVGDYLDITKPKFIGNLKLTNDHYFPIKTYTDFKEDIDPFSSITSSLNKGTSKNTSFIQVNFSPIHDDTWKYQKRIQTVLLKTPKFIKKILLSPYFKFFKILLLPIYYFLQLFALLVSNEKKGKEKPSKEKEADATIMKKLSGFGYKTSINIGVETDSEFEAKINIKEMVTALNFFSISGQNGFELDKIRKDSENLILNRKNDKKIILNSGELAGLVHLPTLYVQTPGINWITTKSLEPPQNLPLLNEHEDISPMGTTNFRGVKLDFGILPADRARHIYIIGKTGMGKSTILENMIYDDVCKGKGVALIDPHGDLADTLVSNIPKNRINDVILFDPSDYKYPIAFNMFENVSKELRPLVASGLIGIFKKMWIDSWGPRLEHILRNCILTLLEIPDATIMSIPLMLTNKSYRVKVVSKIEDPIIKRFWEQEFEVLDPKQMTEAVSPILNKVGQFLSNPILRNVLGQPKNPFSLRWIMDNKKILIVNLSKGKIGEDSMGLLGSMMVTKFQIDAMGRADIPEDKRKDFYLYVDEFQNFATDSFATILSEARKYKLNLIMANQYIEQMNDQVRGAIFGNVGSIVSFQVGPDDATKLANSIGDDNTISTTDLMNIRKYDIYTKLLIDGMPARVFSATTFPPIKAKSTIDEGRKNTVLKVSREKYAKPVEFVEKKIIDFNKKIIEEEKKYKASVEAFKEKIKEEKKKKADDERNQNLQK
ncbi:MAG: type IV secretion system DNA-binding domain-containing protein [Candidatus Gracilibacteria bacterium]|nr:type IV secretion system DNA-binding domain-containing protein [Candidatus Gracilibacteria bacterium]